MSTRFEMPLALTIVITANLCVGRNSPAAAPPGAGPNTPSAAPVGLKPCPDLATRAGVWQFSAEQAEPEIPHERGAALPPAFARKRPGAGIVNPACGRFDRGETAVWLD